MFDRLLAVLRFASGESLSTSLRRRLRAAHPWRIAELREGLHGRVRGTVRAIEGATITAALTGRPCVYYHLEIIQLGSIGDGYAQHLLSLDKRGVPFLLVEDGHHAVIDPTYAELLVSSVREVRARSANQLDPQLRTLLESHDVLAHAQRTPGTLRFSERIIEVGATVAIAGTAGREADPQAMRERGYRDEAQTRLRFVGLPQLPLLIGDPPR